MYTNFWKESCWDWLQIAARFDMIPYAMRAKKFDILANSYSKTGST